MKPLFLLTVLAATGFAQEGLTISGSHPRIYFDATRLAAARAYYAAHPWTPSAINATGVNMNSWAAHSLITNTPGECSTAINTAKTFTATGVVNGQLDLSKFTIAAGPGGITANNMRWYGEMVAEVYDWCYPQLTAADAQLLRDRWVGTTSGPGDPVHAPTDLASASGTSVITSLQSPFLANMAGNNVIIFSGGGTHCPTDRFPILSVTDANTITVSGIPNTGGSASGCTARISGYVDAAKYYDWGGITMPFSNFFWGYWRNEILWGVITSGESGYSSDLLHDALAVRWPVAQTLFAGSGSYATISQKGGIWTESSEYGSAAFGYQILPVLLCQRYGRDLTLETNWYREAGIFSIYNTTLAPTWSPNTSTSYYQQFPWGDDQDFVGYPPSGSTASATGYMAQNSYIVPPPDFVQVLAQIYGGSNLGKLFRAWNQQTGVVLSPWILGGDAGGSTLPLSSNLPLDYFSPGAATLFTKSSWNTNATQVRVMGTMSLAHQHANSGDFAIQRNGVWLTKEWTAYQQSMVCGGYAAAETATPAATCLSQYGYAHNIITMGSAAPDACNTAQTWGNVIPNAGGNAFVAGPGRVMRLDSQPDYSYEVLDISNTYKSIESIDPNHDCRDHNPYADTVVREFLFIRPLETLVIFDRIKAGSNYFTGFQAHPVIAPEQVVKRVLVHSPVVPTIASNTATWDNHGQRMKGWFFGPTVGPDLTNIDEGNFTGHLTTVGRYQQRLEISNTSEVSGAIAGAQSYFATVLRAGDTTGFQDFTTATLADNGATLTLTLNHPTGNAIWTITKGATSTGGSFGFAASGTPSTTALTTRAVPPTVDDTGVTWLNTPLLTAAPASLSFSATVGGTNPASQTTALASAGSTLDNFTTTKSASWLTRSPTSGSAAGNLTVSVDATGLTAGVYSDSISIASTSDVTNSPLSVPVTLTVNSAPVVATASLPNGTAITRAYSQQLAVSGGSAPYSWDIAAGSLCSGLSLSGAGKITGTPAAPGVCGFTARVTDATGVIGTQPLIIAVSSNPGTTTKGIIPRNGGTIR